MRVLILHGWENSSRGNWFPWLKKELESRGIAAYCPDLPNSGFPEQKKWLETIRAAVKILDNSLVIVGHSLGAVAILRLLETFGEGETVRAAILVAGFTDNLGIKPIADFFKVPFNWEKIKTKAEKFVVIHSDDDPYISVSDAEFLKNNLDAEFILEHRAGHINVKSGYLKYERLRDLIIRFNI